MKLRLPCAPGLEKLLAEEIRELALGTPVIEPFAVEMKGGLRSVMRANLELGLATAVWAELASFEASRPSEFARKLRRENVKDWIAQGDRLQVRCQTRNTRLYDHRELTVRVISAIDDQVVGVDEWRPPKDDDGVDAERDPTHRELRVRIDGKRCRVFIETSGAALHRRGYRQEVTRAPLREDLALALVRASGWDRHSPLADPMCGSGTVAIEAALLAGRLPPGAGRRFAFEHAPCFDPALWERVQASAQEARTDSEVRIIASDRDEGAARVAGSNAERAGVRLEVRAAPISESAHWEDATTVVTNPPWGGTKDRLDTGDDVRPLYQRLIEVVGERAAVVLTDPQPGRLLEAAGFGEAFRTRAGGRRVRAYAK